MERAEHHCRSLVLYQARKRPPMPSIFTWHENTLPSHIPCVSQPSSTWTRNSLHPTNVPRKNDGMWAATTSGCSSRSVLSRLRAVFITSTSFSPLPMSSSMAARERFMGEGKVEKASDQEVFLA